MAFSQGKRAGCGRSRPQARVSACAERPREREQVVHLGPIKAHKSQAGGRGVKGKVLDCMSEPLV